MIPNLQGVPKVPAILLVLILSLFHLVQSRGGPFELDDKIDPSFDPNYLENFLEPDSESVRNITGPKAWHVKNMLQVLKLWNYTAKEYSITTEDEYIISLFRMLELREDNFTRNIENQTTNVNSTSPSKNNINNIPVLFLSGFLAGPELWLMSGQGDLPAILSGVGYDLWFGTYRGTNYGRKHVNLTTKDKQFWDFSFHEIGYYDLPAMIDHILKVTTAPRVILIGHSMGNAVVQLMLAMRPEYNDKVKLYIGLAPYAVARLGLHKSVENLFYAILKHNDNSRSTDIFRQRKINPMAGACWSLPRLCFQLLSSLFGNSVGRGNWKLFPVLMTYFPSGSSNKNFKHLLQIGKENFVQYDYGLKGNMVHYKSPTPPYYNLTNVRVPTSLYYGDVDAVVLLKGMNAQVKALSTVVKTTVIKNLNHMDMLVANEMYPLILDDLKKYGT
ncbi:hypothetical protein WDU94_010937 [Cyamophila willieti]